MPVEYEIDGGRVRARLHGRVTTREILGYQDDLRADPDFHPDASVLTDLREADVREITADDVRSIAGNSPLGRNGHLALVVDDDVAYGLSRIFDVGVQRLGAEARVFRDLDQAKLWLEGFRATG